MNIIFTALAALSGITGFSSGHFYETNNEHLQDCLFEHFGSCSSLATEDSFLLINDLYAMDGTNRYLLADMIDGKTVVYDKKEQCISATYDANPYTGLNVEFKLLSDIEDDYMFAYYSEEIHDFVFTNNACFDKENIHSYYTNQGYKAGNYYKGIAYTSDTVKIDNAFYFERLGSRHAHNADGTCTVVAAEMLLGYYDTFVNDNIVDEQYDQPAVESINSSTPTVLDFVSSPGVDTNTNSSFHDYLCDIAKNEIGDDPRSGGMSNNNQKRLITKYLDKRGIQYKTHTSVGNMSDICSNRAKGVIKDTINANRPVIASGEGHSTVAFAYNDKMVWVHTGWGYVAATPWRTFESGMFFNYYAAAIDLEEVSKNNHVHSDNYYATNKNLYICPDGETHTQTDLYPSNYGLTSSYSSSEQKKRFYSNGVEVRNYYTRTALINNNVVLSARKAGEGEAYIQYWFSREIRKYEFDISFYSTSDVLAISNSSIEFSILTQKSDGTFDWVYKENLLEKNISADRNNPTRMKYNFIDEEAYGFRFIVRAPATGTSNGGRVCIGLVSIQNATYDHGLFSAF